MTGSAVGSVNHSPSSYERASSVLTTRFEAVSDVLGGTARSEMQLVAEAARLFAEHAAAVTRRQAREHLLHGLGELVVVRIGRIEQRVALQSTGIVSVIDTKRERRGGESTHSGRRQGAHPQHRVASGSLLPANVGVHVHRGKLGALVAEVDLPAHRSGDVRDGGDGRPTVLAEFGGRVDVQVRVGGSATRSSESSSEDEQVVGGKGLSGKRADTMKRDYTFGVSSFVP